MRHSKTLLLIALVALRSTPILAQSGHCHDIEILSSYFSLGIQTDDSEMGFTVPMAYQVPDIEERLFYEPGFLQKENLWNHDTRRQDFERAIADIVCLSDYTPARIAALQELSLQLCPDAIKDSPLDTILSSYISQVLDLNDTLDQIQAKYIKPAADVGSVLNAVKLILNTATVPTDLKPLGQDVVNFFASAPPSTYNTPSAWANIQGYLSKFEPWLQAFHVATSAITLGTDVKQIIVTSTLAMALANDAAWQRYTALKEALSDDPNLTSDPAFTDAMQDVAAYLQQTKTQEFATAVWNSVVANQGSLTSGTISLASAIFSKTVQTALTNLVINSGVTIAGGAAGLSAMCGIGLFALTEEFSIINGISQQVDDAQASVAYATLAFAICSRVSSYCELRPLSTYAYYRSAQLVAKAASYYPISFLNPYQQVVTQWQGLAADFLTLTASDFNTPCTSSFIALSAGGVTPVSGPTISPFTFSVVCSATSDNKFSPDSIWVVLDSTKARFPLTSLNYSGDWRSGVLFSYQTSPGQFTKGIHHYLFEAVLRGDTLNYPKTGQLVFEVLDSSSLSVKLLPADTTVSVGDTVEAYAVVDSVDSLYSVACDINYSPKVLEFEKVVEEPFLSDGETNKTSLMVSNNSRSGVAIMGLSRLGADRAGVSAVVPVRLFKILFKAISSGSAGVQLSNFGLVGGSGKRIDAASASSVCTASVSNDSQNVRVYLSPSSSSVTVGSLCTFNIRISPVRNLYAFACDVNFDPESLQLQNAIQGGFLNSGGTVQTQFLNSVDTQKGKIILGITRMNKRLGGATTDSAVNVVQLTFKSVSDSSTSLSLTNVGLVSSAPTSSVIVPVVSPGSLTGVADFGTPKLKLTNSLPSATVDSSFSVSLMVDSVTNAFSVAGEIHFDARYLRVIGATEGNFLKGTSGNTSFMSSIDSSNGVITFGITRLGAQTGDVSAYTPQRVLSVEFSSLAVGDAKIQVTKASILNEYGVASQQLTTSIDTVAIHGTPVLVLPTQKINIPAIPILDSISMMVPVVNVGKDSLDITSITFAKGQAFFTAQPAPQMIGPSDTLSVFVWFKPTAYGSYLDTLILASDGGSGRVAFESASPIPNIKLNSSTLSFGDVANGSTRQLPLKLINTSINRLVVDSAFARSRWFSANPTSLVVTDTSVVNVSFKPDSTKLYTDTLYILNNSQTPIIKVPLLANDPPPLLSVVSTTLSFAGAAKFDSSSLDVTIKNSSINPLTVSSLDTKTTAFHVTASVPLKIQGNDSAQVHIVFTPLGFGTFHDTLEIVSNGGSSLMPLSASSPFPMALINRSRVNFGICILGTAQSQAITVKDSSINGLTIDTMYTKTPQYTVNVKHGDVSKLDSLNIKITFIPDTIGTFLDTLFIHNNSQTAVYALPLSGSSPLPEISFINALSDFTAKVGQSVIESLKITSISVNALILDSARTGTKYFQLAGTFPDTLNKADTALITLSFLPDSVRSYEDTLFIYSNASNSPMKMALSGSGSTPTGILREGDAIPTVYDLYQNYPNPFNPTTTIKFALPTQSQVTVTIYDILGREVKELVNDKLQAGYYHFTWDGSRYASGVYFYRIVAQSLGGDKKNFVQVKKLLLLK